MEPFFNDQTTPCLFDVLWFSVTMQLRGDRALTLQGE